VHTLLEQSLPALQVLPVPQRTQLELPPQSVSLSPSFLTLSLQAGAMHSPPVHTPLWQSEAPPHTLPSPHLPQVPPPQSTSVSAPFFLASVQLGAWQSPPVHTRLRQSVPAEQALPVAQPPQVPPQSVSVSDPFFVRSMHVGAWHFFGEPVHTPL
jgi:hypothetical protein